MKTMLDHAEELNRALARHGVAQISPADTYEEEMEKILTLILGLEIQLDRANNEHPLYPERYTK